MFYIDTLLIKRLPRVRAILQKRRMRQMLFFKALNIIVTYRCNLSCPYCYEQSMRFQEDMTIEEFEHLMEWMKKNRLKRIIIMGGEPTQHARFSHLLERCMSNNMEVGLLTNMLFDDAVLKAIKKYMFPLYIQANINHPDTYKKGEYEKIKNNFKKLYRSVSGFIIRYNLHGKNCDSAAVVRLARSIHSPIRFSLTNSPVGCEGRENAVTPSIETLKVRGAQQIRQFLKMCKKHKVAAFFARPVPQCMFSEEERSMYAYNGIKYRCYVGRDGDYASRLNVNPDLTIMGCYGVPVLGPCIVEFNAYDELKTYYRNIFEDLRQTPIADECFLCKSFADQSCQGGCLSEKRLWNT